MMNKQLTNTSVVAIDFAFFGRHVTIDAIVRNDGNHFIALLPVHGKSDVTLFRMEIPSTKSEQDNVNDLISKVDIF